MDQAVTFTATRSPTRRGRIIMRQVVMSFLLSPPSMFVSGAAYGGDSALALASWVCFPESVHHICIPEYTHNTELVETLALIKEQRPDEKIIIDYTGLPPLGRNDYMLDLGDVLYAFPSTEREQHRGSGTWACIRHARKRGMPIFFYPCNGAESWQENT